MVNRERVRRKIPQLLVNGNVRRNRHVTHNFQEYKKIREKIRKMERTKPFRLESYVLNITELLKKLEQELM